VVGRTGITIANDFTAGRELTSGFEQGLNEKGGKIVDKKFVPFGTADYSPYITDFRNSGVDFIWSTLIGTDSANFVKQYDTFGLKDKFPLIGVGSINSDDLLPAEGDSALGLRVNFPYTPTLGNDRNQRYLRVFRKLYNADPSSLSVFAYDAMQLVHNALLLTKGDTNVDVLRKAMEKAKFTSPRGPVSFDPVTHGVTQRQYVLRTVKKDGKLRNVVVAILGTYTDHSVVKANY
jgi:branched-chain amino acid transport system substrate-binding protein